VPHASLQIPHHPDLPAHTITMTFLDTLSLEQCHALRNLLDDGQKAQFEGEPGAACSTGAGNGGYVPPQTATLQPLIRR
jgi:hypothetical protein